MKALGIDLGTTTISAAVLDRENGGIADARTVVNGSFIASRDAWAKVQDTEIILDRAKALTDSLLDTHRDIGVIGLTGQMHGIAYTDAGGRALSPLFTWQDGRGDLPVFNGRSACAYALERTGIRAASGYGLITHLYNMKTDAVPRDAAGIRTVMDLLATRLTGRADTPVHASCAASMGFFDARGGHFRTDALDTLGIDARLVPEVTESFVPVGTYRGIPVTIPVGDNQASFLGSVSDPESSVLLNMGTGGQISVLSDTFFEGHEIEARPFMKGRYLLAGSSLCGGRAYACLAEFFRLTANALGIDSVDPYAVMDRLLSGLPDDIVPPTVSTTFAGTRSDPGRRGAVNGLTEKNLRPDALTYGVLQGMTDELYEMYGEITRGLNLERSQLIASGNGLRRNARLRDIAKKRFCMPLTLSENTEEAACGAALSGLIALGFERY